VLAQGSGATVWVAKSTITGNVTGWGTAAGGVLNSYGDNNLGGNTNSTPPPTNTISTE
jgi:hypothetical protein